MSPLRRLLVKFLKPFNAWHKRRLLREAREAYRAIAFEPGDLAIDCGANVGDVTLDLAARGATVHAFEPNPDVFEVLASRTRSQPEVYCYQQAVANHAGTVSLYLHRERSANPLAHSGAPSLVATKHNLDPGRSVEVTAIDLADFIEAFPGRVRLLKIDVEGYEVVLLDHLIDRGVLRQVDHVFCETHELKVPGLLRETRRLRRRLAEEQLTHVNLGWA